MLTLQARGLRRGLPSGPGALFAPAARFVFVMFGGAVCGVSDPKVR
ncbi:hypothetical protein ABZT04_41280 [Streptomyces sp. NPDC005492]